MITITFPWPDPVLFPNRKGGAHWGKYQRAKVNARLEGYTAALQAVGRDKPSLPIRTHMKVTFHAPDRRRRDWDGLAGSVKHHIDGIAEALGVDDSIFRPVIVDDALDPNKQGFVTVEIGA